MRIHIRAPTVGGFSRILEISVAQRRDVRPGAGAQARIRAACGGTARNLRRRHACLGRTRRSVAKIAAARRLKARKSDPRRMCSQRHHAAPHSRAPRAAHRAPSRAAKGPRPGPGPVPTGQRPTRARRRRFGALFRANAPCAFSGNPHARSLARSASGGARRPAAGAIDAKKSALQAAASTASARAPAAPHGPGERAGQSFARARALTCCQRAAPRNRLAHRRAAGHTCRGRWMPRRQRPARAARRAPAPAGRRPRRRALPSSPDFSPQFLFYFRGHSGAFDPTPGCTMVNKPLQFAPNSTLFSLGDEPPRDRCRRRPPRLQ